VGLPLAVRVYQYTAGDNGQLQLGASLENMIITSKRRKNEETQKATA